MRRAVPLALIAVLTLTTLASAQFCEEAVEVTAGPGTIYVDHSNAEFNCCSWTDVDVAHEGYSIVVTEYERFEEGPCFCFCCFEVSASVSGLDPGDYEVEVVKAYDNFDGSWTYEPLGVWFVTVGGESLPAVFTSYVPCANVGAASGPASWGVIKALYR
jgi:hypothetical protein